MKASSVSAYLELARWQNCLIAAAGVVVGAIWAGGRHPQLVAWVAGSAILFTCAANAWNDVDDIEIDRIAHPDRPIPAGKLTRVQAASFALKCVILAQVPTIFVSLWLLAISVVVGQLLLFYGGEFKRSGFPGNLIVAALASLPFLYGAGAVDNPDRGSRARRHCGAHALRPRDREGCR